VNDLLGDIGKLNPELAESVRLQQQIDHLDYTPTCDVRFRRFTLDTFGEKTLAGPIVASCGDPAAVSVVCTWCGHEANACQTHREQIEAQKLIDCGKCEQRGEPHTLLRFEPLAGV
jgi:hypothetical protein